MPCYLNVEPSWLRDVILGRIIPRKCPNCDKNGIEIQAYGDDGEPCPSDREDAVRHECEECNAVGFLFVDPN